MYSLSDTPTWSGHFRCENLSFPSLLFSLPAFFATSVRKRDFMGGSIANTRSNPQLLAETCRTELIQDWPAISKRLGWLSFEDMESVVPGACPWFHAR